MTRDSSSNGDTRQWQIWFGLFGGIAAWTLHLTIGYLLVYNGCALGLEGLSIWLLILTIALGLVALTATVVAYRSWHESSTRGGNEAGEVLGRRRLLAVMGTGLSGLSLLILLFSLIAIVVLGPCA